MNPSEAMDDFVGIYEKLAVIIHYPIHALRSRDNGKTREIKNSTECEEFIMISAIQEKIMQLKKEKDIAILAHSYQSPDILEIADLKGDSFKLSADASKLSQKTLLLCGVRFMAETVKTLSPEKTVILPVENATCPMAEMIRPQDVVSYKQEHPDCKVVAYVNTTTQLKAVSDVCVTSSSAVQIVGRMPEQEILFIPDKNLGSFVREKCPDKNIITWDGCCPVHDQVTEQDVLEMKRRYPGYKLLVHPECKPEVAKHADYAGSTAGILSYARGCQENILVGTEKSIADSLALEFPERQFIPLSKRLMCHDMRITNLVDVYRAMQGLCGCKIEIEEETRLKAKHAIDEMIRLGQ